MSRQKIVMNFSVAPSLEDLEVIAQEAIESLPQELLEHCEDLNLMIEDFPDDTLESELGLEDPYELVAFFRSGQELSPGVKTKANGNDDLLIIFRRPLLDIWCESGEDIHVLTRQIIIEELGQNFEMSEDDIEAMVANA